MRIYVSNQSSSVSNTQLTQMIAAMNILLTNFCTDWGLSPIQLFQSFTRVGDVIPNNTIFIFNNSDSPGALGYHFDQSGLAIGKVFARTIINYGGSILYKDNSTFTVAQCLAHEAFEMICDNSANKWVLDNNSTFWAYEVSDAVQNNLYVVTLPGGIKVGLSDYVLPSWFDSNSVSGPYNKMNTLTRPLTLDRGGYSIIIRGNRVSQVFGMGVTNEKKNDVLNDVVNIKKKFGLL